MTVSTSTVSIQGPDGAFSAFMASPDPAHGGPAIVVIQEIFGVNAVMRSTCTWLAGQGYAAICPDLFWRIQPGIDITDQTDAELKQAFDLYGKFNVATGVTDIAATIAWLRGRGHARVGAVGYCLGGLLSFLTGVRTDADACVSYYGVGIDGFLAEAGNSKADLLLHIAQEDGFVSPDAQAKLHAALKPPRFTLFNYPGRDHAFARTGGANHHPGDAERANQRTLDFLAQRLKG